MKPEEKAKELIEKFQDITALKVTLDYETTVDEIINHAKQCALICVDEILKDLIESFKISREMHPHAQGLIAGSLSFWQEVKSIIEESK